MALHGVVIGRVAALLALVSTLLAPRPHASGTPVGRGLQGGWAVDNRGDVGFARSVVATLPLVRQAGADWVRINFRLGACYHDWTSTGCNGRTALQAYDAVVGAAERQGLNVLGLISNESWRGDQAEWLQNSAENELGNGDNAYLRAFSLGAAVPLVRYFEGRIGAWEVWNEPNAYTAHDGAGGYHGGTFIYPSNLAWLLRHVYEDTRRAGIRSARFVSGGLLSHDGAPLALVSAAALVVPRMRSELSALWEAAVRRGAPMPEALPPGIELTLDQSGAAYLRATYRYGRSLAGWERIKARYGSYPLDGIGQHLYVAQGGAADAAAIAAYLQLVRDAYVAFEGPETAKQTFVTEFGWQTRTLAPKVQASNLQLACDTFAATGYVAQAYWYAVQDIPEAASFYGLAGADGSLKPAFAAYQAAVSRAETQRR